MGFSFPLIRFVENVKNGQKFECCSALRTRLCDRQQKHKWILKRSNQFEFTEIAEIQRKIHFSFSWFYLPYFHQCKPRFKIWLGTVNCGLHSNSQSSTKAPSWRIACQSLKSLQNRKFDGKIFDLQWKFFASLTAFDRRRLILNRIGMMKREFALKVCKSFRKQRFGRRGG